MFTGLDERFDVFGGMFQYIVVEKDMAFLEDHDDGRAAEREETFLLAAEEDGTIMSLCDGGDGKSSDLNEERLSEIGEIKQGDFAIVRRENIEILVES